MTAHDDNNIVTAHTSKDNSSVKYIAHFTNGRIKEKNASNLSFGQYVKTGDSRKRKQTILVGETKDMSYVGKNFGPDASKAQSYCRYYIGVVDRKHRKMRVYDSEIMQMIPKLPNFQEEEAEQSISLPLNTDKTYKEKIDDLTASFGSKKKKQAMGSRLRNEIRGEALEKALSSAVDDAVSQKRNLGASVGSEDNQSSLIPPCNKEANRPQDVYCIDDIISSQEMEVLTTSADVFYNCKKADITTWQKQEEYSSYILNHLAILPSATENRWRKAKMLMYLHYLITAYKKPAKQYKVKGSFPQEWPDLVTNTLLNKFTALVTSGDRRSRCVPKSLKDKMLLNILVLCLILDEFELPLNDLQKDLKIGGKSIETNARVLGCRVKVQKLTSEDGEKIEIRTAMLEIPLRFPEATPKKAKARR